MASPLNRAALRRAWNDFFFSEEPQTILGLIRVFYAVLLMFNLLTLLPYLELWFSESGALPRIASEKILDPDAFSLLWYIPDSLVPLVFFFLLLCCGLLACNILPRLQALLLFLGLNAIQHRAILLFDGEDTLFRLFAFYLLLLPLSSLRRADGSPRPQAIWGLRLLQIQMTLIYVSTVMEKFRGAAWAEGYAVYYVSRLDDFFAFRAWTAPLFDSLPLLQLLTWSTLAVECALPLALWFEPTRRYAVYIGILFHLGLNFFMHLFLFQYLMIVGLLSFLHAEELPAPLERIALRFSS